MNPKSATKSRSSTAATEKTAPPCRGKARVLLVDDHPVLRKGLMAIINQEEDLAVCGEVEEAPKAFEAVGRLQPDVVVIDISLRKGNGLELIKDLKARHRDLPLLVLSMHEESLYAERALRAGGLGYVMKQEAIKNLLAAIRDVLAGKMFLSDRMKARLMDKLVGAGVKPRNSSIGSLSDRELEVFRMIGEGRGTRQIADGLQLSIRTVEAYREYIKGKLNIGNGTALHKRAFHHVNGSGPEETDTPDEGELAFSAAAKSHD